MNKIIKNLGLGLSAVAMSFAALAIAPISTYAAELPSCYDESSEDNPWGSCIYARGGYSSTGEALGAYSVRKGASYELGSLISSDAEGYISYKISDTSVVSLTDFERSSGDYRFTVTALYGVKSGTANLVYTLKSTGETLLTVPIEVYGLSFQNGLSVAVGSSRDFSITTDSNIELTGVEVLSYLSEYATLKNNGSGSYTLTVNAMPYGIIGMGSEEEEPLPFIEVAVDAKNKTTGAAYSTAYMTFNVYESKTEDQASAATSDTATELANQIKLETAVSALLDAVLSDDSEASDGDTVTLSDGSKFAVADIDALKEAFAAGETIEVSLAKPTTISTVDDAVSSTMEAELPANTTGARYLDINVLVSAGDKTFGNLTEVGSALTVSVDVSDDSEVASGYTRTYYVVRLHDGVAERLSTTYDADSKVVSFDSDKFSTYLIAYEDTKTSSSISAPDSGFNTKNVAGSSASYATLILLATTVTVLGAVAIVKKAKSLK